MFKFSFFILSLILNNAVQADTVCDQAKVQFQESIEIYKKSGNTEFMKSVLKNGPLEGDTRSLSQSQLLGQIEQFFGRLISASVLSTKTIGIKSCYIIGVLEYENGPAFTVANYYKGAKGVVVTSMTFKTEPELILPAGFLAE
ncbi:MAG: hypothetical protein KA365_01295 [Arenimonas sp.]|nr:hypothetical protein [Arenimonas sp.]